MGSYYNDTDPFVCDWLRNLIAAGHLPPGDVDERSILEVTPGDVRSYTHCHWFAGIGGWPLALQWAGWPDGRPVWTGSCPCQPFSIAGKRQGHADERHLWPAFHALISECAPPVVFGEQVASKDGREWLAAVRADLEHLGYACGAADLPAASVGAPHIRQRLFWVADTNGSKRWNAKRPERRDAAKAARSSDESGRRSNAGGLADAEHFQWGAVDGPRQDGCDGQDSGREKAQRQPGARGQVRAHANPWAGGLGNAEHDGPPTVNEPEGTQNERRLLESERPSWASIEWLPCADGKARPAPHAQSGIHPLADGVPGRVGRLRGYGNAIVPQAAQVFVESVMDILAA